MFKTILLIAIILSSYTAYSQSKIKVEEKNKDGHKVMVTTIYEASKADVEKAWRSKMKNMGCKISQGGLFADDCKWSKIGDNTFDVYCKLNNGDDNSIQMEVAVDLGGTYLSSSSHASQFKAMKNLLYDFAVETTRNAIGDQLKEAESLLSTYEKEQKKLIKRNEKLHELIEECKEKITQAEADIKENETNQDDKIKQIEEQTKVVEEVKIKLNATK